MKLALLAAILASALFCGWSGPIDVDNALRPALSHNQLKGIGRLLRVDSTVAVTDWECSTCKILFTELQNLFLKNATDEKIMAHITEYCIRLKIEDKLVCTAIVIEFKVIYVVLCVHRYFIHHDFITDPSLAAAVKVVVLVCPPFPPLPLPSLPLLIFYRMKS